MKIVVLDSQGLCQNDLDYGALSAFCDVTVYERTPAEQVIQRIGDAQAVITNKVVMTREVIAACKHLTYIGVSATGYNIVDMQAAKERDIVVTNAPAYSTCAVAQHVFALLLHEFSRVASYDARVKAGQWQRSESFCFIADPMYELCGKTLGIIGFGSVGQAVARIALAMQMNLLVCTPHPKVGWESESLRFAPLDAVIAGSDIITLHCPLTEKTNGLIDAQTIARMKPGVRVINTARGAVVNETAMAQALESGHVACYMADVLCQEPPTVECPLLHAPNTVLTPHVAWAPRQTRERLLHIVVDNVRAFVQGAPRNVVSA